KGKGDDYDEKRLQILNYINNHYNSVTLEEVADHFHYSIPYCSKLIQSEAGINFVSFVRQVRMNHATAMLRNTEMPISEISYMIGYENTESFIRAFKKVFDQSPSAYRKENRSADQNPS
ncbi:MAG: AraC family transcriptional regulator, partial [Erysipelotrichaceae bacterium]|nr:AraC family transcriptional regulator [Erysipelotrichaceae bacterium]